MNSVLNQYEMIVYSRMKFISTIKLGITPPENISHISHNVMQCLLEQGYSDVKCIIKHNEHD